jgi:hypothetical protein
VGGTAIDCTANAPATGAAGTVAGAVQFRGATAVFAADDTNFIWDDTNNRLGIGTATPGAPLEIRSTLFGQPHLRFRYNGTIAHDIVTSWHGGSPAANFMQFRVYDGSGGTDTQATVMTLNGAGAVGIGTTTPSTALNVVGASQTGAGADGTLNLAQTWDTTGTPTAIKLNITDTASAAASKLLDLQTGGVSRVKILKDGSLDINGSNLNTYLKLFRSDGATFTLTAGAASMFVNGRIQVHNDDAFIALMSANQATRWFTLYHDSPQTNTMAMRYGTNAQELRIYNTDNGANDEFLSLGYKNNANVFTMESEKTGTGILRDIALMGGNVGIGTTSPTRTLDVNGPVVLEGGSAGAGTITTRGIHFFDDGSTAYMSARNADATRRGLVLDAAVHQISIGGSEKARIDPSGNVGIGTTAPAYALDVAGASGIGLSEGGTGTYDSTIVHSATSPFRFLTLTSKAGTGTWRGAINFDTNYNAGAIFTAMTVRANTDGTSANVGIGTTSPGSALDVNGNAMVRDALYGGQNNAQSNFHIEAYNGSGTKGIYLNYFLGTAVYLAGNVQVTSDIRKKKDISTISDALSRVSRIRGVSYKWKDPKRDHSTQIGVIAQEVQKEFPELVKDDGYGYLTVNYEGLAAPLIEAVKDLKAANDNLRAIVEEQGRAIEQLKRAR